MAYDYQPFPYVAPPGLTAPEPRHPVVIVGAGPIGLAMAIELANHGIKSVVGRQPRDLLEQAQSGDSGSSGGR